MYSNITNQLRFGLFYTIACMSPLDTSHFTKREPDLIPKRASPADFPSSHSGEKANSSLTPLFLSHPHASHSQSRSLTGKLYSESACSLPPRLLPIAPQQKPAHQNPQSPSPLSAILSQHRYPTQVTDSSFTTLLNTLNDYLSHSEYNMAKGWLRVPASVPSRPCRPCCALQSLQASLHLSPFAWNVSSQRLVSLKSQLKCHLLKDNLATLQPPTHPAPCVCRSSSQHVPASTVF